MSAAPQIFYNLVTRDALVLFRDQAVVLDGPFNSRDDAEIAAEETIARLEDAELFPERKLVSHR